MRENCLEQFKVHWNCLEYNNQVRGLSLRAFFHLLKLFVALVQEYRYCRKPERALNKCMFEKLVSGHVRVQPRLCLSSSCIRAWSKLSLEVPRARHPSTRSKTQYTAVCRSRRSNAIAYSSIYGTIQLLAVSNITVVLWPNLRSCISLKLGASRCIASCNRIPNDQHTLPSTAFYRMLESCKAGRRCECEQENFVELYTDRCGELSRRHV